MAPWLLSPTREPPKRRWPFRQATWPTRATLSSAPPTSPVHPPPPCTQNPRAPGSLPWVTHPTHRSTLPQQPNVKTNHLPWLRRQSEHRRSPGRRAGQGGNRRRSLSALHGHRWRHLRGRAGAHQDCQHGARHGWLRRPHLVLRPVRVDVRTPLPQTPCNHPSRKGIHHKSNPSHPYAPGGVRQPGPGHVGCLHLHQHVGLHLGRVE